MNGNIVARRMKMFGIKKRHQKRAEEKRRREEERLRKEAEKRAEIKRYMRWLPVFIGVCLTCSSAPSFSMILFAVFAVMSIPVKQINDLWDKILKGKTNKIKIVALGVVFVIACVFAPFDDNEKQAVSIGQTEVASAESTEIVETTESIKTTEATKNTEVTHATEKTTEAVTIETQRITETEATDSVYDDVNVQSDISNDYTVGDSSLEAVDSSQETEQQAVINDNLNVNDGSSDIPASNNKDTGSTNGSVIVHITNTGSKYHLGGCRYLKSDIEVTLDEAKAKGLSPCGVCNPPR